MSSLNKDEFNKNIFSGIEKLVLDYNLIKKGDLIAVALSGGKDSTLTLHALKKIQNKLDFDLIAISVDEGIEGYRKQGIEVAIKNAKLCNVQLIEKSFYEEFNINLDDIYSNFKSACIPCGVFRRYILNKTAYELGASKIATGHNLDDEIQSFLMSFARGDVLKFSKFSPELNKIHPKLIPRIKPLWKTLESDIKLWVKLNNIQVDSGGCPYSSLSLRSKIKSFLNDYEKRCSGAKKNIMNSFIKSLNVVNTPPTLYECEICGEPTSSNVCKACELLKMLSD